MACCCAARRSSPQPDRYGRPVRQIARRAAKPIRGMGRGILGQGWQAPRGGRSIPHDHSKVSPDAEAVLIRTYRRASIDSASPRAASSERRSALRPAIQKPADRMDKARSRRDQRCAEACHLPQRMHLLTHRYRMGMAKGRHALFLACARRKPRHPGPHKLGDARAASCDLPLRRRSCALPPAWRKGSKNRPPKTRAGNGGCARES